MQELNMQELNMQELNMQELDMSERAETSPVKAQSDGKIDGLIQTIHAEAARRNREILNRSEATLQRSTLLAISNDIEAFVANAESRSHARTKWPDKLNRLPFRLLSPVRRGILKVLNVLFRDQREVNLNLIHALRKSLLVQRHLLTQLEEVQSQNQAKVANLEAQIRVLKAEMERLE